MPAIQATGFAPAPNAATNSMKQVAKDVVDITTSKPKTTGNKEVDELNKLLVEQKKKERKETIEKILTPKVVYANNSKLDTLA